MPEDQNVSVRIKLEPSLWRTIRAAAMLDGISAAEWIARLARHELAGVAPAPVDQPQREDADGPDRD